MLGEAFAIISSGIPRALGFAFTDVISSGRLQGGSVRGQRGSRRHRRKLGVGVASTVISIIPRALLAPGRRDRGEAGSTASASLDGPRLGLVVGRRERSLRQGGDATAQCTAAAAPAFAAAAASTPHGLLCLLEGGVYVPPPPREGEGAEAVLEGAGRGGSPASRGKGGKRGVGGGRKGGERGGRGGTGEGINAPAGRNVDRITPHISTQS